MFFFFFFSNPLFVLDDDFSALWPGQLWKQGGILSETKIDILVPEL